MAARPPRRRSGRERACPGGAGRAKSRVGAVRAAGFAGAIGLSRPAQFELWVAATRQPVEQDDLKRLLAAHLAPRTATAGTTTGGQRGPA